MARFTIDSNILVYSVDSCAGSRRATARQVIEAALAGDYRLTLQAVSGFYAAVTRKGIMPAAVWSALAIAAEAGCEAILTEHLADGAVSEGVRIVKLFWGDDRLEDAVAWHRRVS